jgi:hypothetical protein
MNLEEGTGVQTIAGKMCFGEELRTCWMLGMGVESRQKLVNSEWLGILEEGPCFKSRIDSC